MTLIEACLLTLAIVAVLFVGVAVFAVTRLFQLWGAVEVLLRDVRELVRRLDTVATEWEDATRETREVRRRIMSTANRVLDEVEPPIRQVAAILSGVRAGLGAIFRSTRDGHETPERPAPERQPASERKGP